jgi:hypothetical protein
MAATSCYEVTPARGAIHDSRLRRMTAAVLDAAQPSRQEARRSAGVRADLEPDVLACEIRSIVITETDRS